MYVISNQCINCFWFHGVTIMVSNYSTDTDFLSSVFRSPFFFEYSLTWFVEFVVYDRLSNNDYKGL